MEREDILAQIRRTARENGGRPLGALRFEQETGIRRYDWERYWARFGDAQREAGFEANKLTPAFSDDYLLQSVADLTRELRRFPTDREMRLKRINHSDFPGLAAFRRFTNKKSQLVGKLLTFWSG